MALPASWTQITVTGTYTNHDGSPASGWITFESRQQVTIGGVVIVPKTITVELDGAGSFSYSLPSTNDPELSVTGWAYLVTEHFDSGNGRQPFLLEVPYTSPSINLATAPHATYNASVQVSSQLSFTDIGTLVASETDVQSAQNAIDTLTANLLNSSYGASLVTYKRSGTANAVARLLSKKLDQYALSVFDFMTDAQVADWQAGTGLVDVTTALQNAINYVEEQAGFCRPVLHWPAGLGLISSTLTVSKAQTWKVDGYGDTSTGPDGSGGGVVMLQWSSAAAASKMIRIISPVSATFIHGLDIRGLLLNGNSVATHGIHGSSMSRCKIDVSIFRCTTAHALFDDGNTALNQFNEFYVHSVWGTNAACANAHGLWIKGGVTGNPQNHIRALGLFKDGDGLRIEGDVDNCILEHVAMARNPGGSGRNLAWIAATAVPRCNLVQYFAGGIAYHDTGTYGQRYLFTTNEGTDMSGPGQWHLDGIVDYATGGMWGTDRFLLSDEIMFTPGDFNVSGLGAGATLVNLGSHFPCWTLDPAANEAIATSRRIPRNWNNSSITQIRINFSFEAAPGVGTAVVFKVYASTSSPQAGTLIGTPTSKQTTVALPSNNIRRNFEALITFDTPVVIPDDGMIVLAIQRMGSDINDTATTDVYITGAGVLMTSTGPNSAGSGTLTIPSMGS